MSTLSVNKKYREDKKAQQELKKKEKILAKQKDKYQLSLKPKVTGQKKTIKKDRLPTGEKELFFEIRNERPKICIICSKAIKEAKTRCFAHILAKWQRPKYRLYKNNIVLVCSIDCHHKVDSMIVGKKKLVEDQILSWIIPDIKWLI